MTARENQEQLAMAGYASSYNITWKYCIEMIFTNNKNWNKLRKHKKQQWRQIRRKFNIGRKGPVLPF